MNDRYIKAENSGVVVREDDALRMMLGFSPAPRPSAPTVDLLSLYETIGMAATTINVAADSIYAAHLMGQKPWLPMTDAKAAAERVLRALKEYEDQIETMESGS